MENYDMQQKKKLVNADRGVDDDDVTIVSQLNQTGMSLRRDLTQLNLSRLMVSSHMTGDLDLRGKQN